MIGRIAALIYGMASYLVSFCSVLYAMAFIGNYLVPKSIDVGFSRGRNDVTHTSGPNELIGQKVATADPTQLMIGPA
jgi:hypothetical protein